MAEPKPPPPPAPRDAPSEVRMYRIVMPGQTNSHGTLFGGVALALMDEAAAIVAIRHARSAIVTAHIQEVDFRAPIRLGEAVEIHAYLRSVGRTSMRVVVETYGENLVTGERRHCTSAEFVLVAVGADGKPTPVPPFAPGPLAHPPT